MENNKHSYWKGLEELNQDPKFLENKRNEFAEGIPLDEVFTEEDGGMNANRRDFLKYFGFGISAVALAACNKAPIKNAIPYIVKPENITPGIPNYYASTTPSGCSILVKTREGRPIKIEGNPESPIFKGGVSAADQGTLLGLYDNERLKAPMASGKEASWDAVDADIKKALASASNIRVVSGTLNSPSGKRALATFMAKYPSAKHIQYEAFSQGAIAEANQIAFGKNVIPGYRFDKANVIVSFGADFLGTWISPVEFAKQWSSTRTAENKKMSRHIQFESYLSVTGSNADVRYPIKPSAEGVYLISLYNKIAALAGVPALGSMPAVELPLNMIELTAKELWAAKGASLVVCGSNNLDHQLLVAAINSMLGNVGSTYDLDNYSNQHYSNDAAFDTFANELASGAVDAVIFWGTNPVYSYYNSAKLAEGIRKAKLSVSTNLLLDETSELCKYNAPAGHFLESWNDSEPKAGYFALTQPTISPVFNTRQAEESLLRWADNTSNYYDFIRETWKGMAGGSSEEAWVKSLHDGFYYAGPKATSAPKFAADLSSAVNAAYSTYTTSKAKKELKLYSKVGVLDGTHSNNPWLQELPDPISKVTWDNYANVSKATADELGLKEGDLITISSKAGKIESIPVLIQPGQPNNVIAVAVGYGRTSGGKVAKLAAGKNAYGMAALSNKTTVYGNFDITIEKVGSGYELAQTQTHHTIEGRAIIKEASLGEYVKDAKAGNHDHHATLKENGNLLTLWGEHDSKGHKWTMAVDLNKCTGCGACVVACNAENNVPVVGRAEVLKRREMHWIRIDRYYKFKDKEGKGITREKGNASAILKAEGENVYSLDSEDTTTNFEDVSVVHQPLMCQHCGHAPCETVCPVLATVHSSEGLNHMAYNRCVGTRYCANNCPYKVRRFNWFKYRENDQFDFNFNNDLGRMVINPDVTVRSRGVMEKCSFCVQRIQAGKLKAKLENRTIKDGDVKTACQQTCPSDAIIFGDINDANSEVAKYFKNERSYFLLDEYNVQPSVAYLTKVRNIDEKLAEEHHGAAKHKAEPAGEHKKEESHS
ncbi:MAG: TAT-variant-translocated molybdopterin oxidoreductase [Bacteroidetes bacterium]|nr:TAT-variant-translocated molybdopterin oxidoreductase [Bacteroidota bacterium]